MIIDAADERSEQGRLLSKSPGSSNAVLGSGALETFLAFLALISNGVLAREKVLF
jgi:hypothetical protein